MKQKGQIKNMHALFIKDADRIDSAVWNEGEGIKGQSWHVDITIEGSLDDNGFIYDFSLLKKTLKNTLKGCLDHALLVPNQAKNILVTLEEDKIKVADGSFMFEGPANSVFFLPCQYVTRSAIESALNGILKEKLPARVLRVRTKLREEESQKGAFFHYTHGITGHDGHCQRLFHGHRSLIEVFINGKRREDLESFLAGNLLKGSIHIGDEGQVSRKEAGLVHLAYRARDGVFKGTVPEERFLLVEKGTSIETIVEFFAEKLSSYMEPKDHLEVYGYEGIGKGAMAERGGLH